MKTNPSTQLLSLFEDDSSAVNQRLYADLAKNLNAAFDRYLASAETMPDKDPLYTWGRDEHISLFLMDHIRTLMDQAAELNLRRDEFGQHFSMAVSQEEKNEHVLFFSEQMGADPRQLRSEKRAFSRWFGYDVVIERCARKIAYVEYTMDYAMGRLGKTAARALKPMEKDRQARMWKHLAAEPLLKKLLAYPGDIRVCIAAFQCLSTIIRSLTDELRETGIQEDTLSYVYRASLETRQHVWIQAEALTLLLEIAPESFVTVTKKRLHAPVSGDDLFFRKKAVLMIKDHLDHLPDLIDHLPIVLSDPSPFVRQALCQAVAKVISLGTGQHQDALAWITALAIKDPSYQVRAAAVMEIARLIVLPRLFPEVLRLFNQVFKDTNPFVLRVAFTCAADAVALLTDNNQGEQATFFFDSLIPSLDRLHMTFPDISVRRWASQCSEKMQVCVDADLTRLKSFLEQKMSTVPGQGSIRVPKSAVKGHDDVALARVLSVMANESFGFSVQKGVFHYRIWKGDRFAFRLWRAWFEFFNPSPDKRQAHNHTIGRCFKGSLHSPSGILSELTQTSVPGEPLHMATEAGWRPYLPLLDLVLSSLKLFSSKPLTLFSAEGITTITPPRFIGFRALAILTICLRFQTLASLRNWNEKNNSNPSAYIRRLEDLGFKFRFDSYFRLQKPIPKDPMVERFFAFPLPFMAPQLWQSFKSYFFSVYENSLYELGLFTGLFLLFFMGVHLYKSWTVRRARKKIKLMIGGWGTRGKSGTERIKAALFEAIGHSITSKSTGCEAMFLQAAPFCKTRELFLFRPYDKATIWEHHHLMHMAVSLKSKIFLWECMALTPAYVRILQHQWSRDDYATITNAYPDHEDIQGPAGYDIPKVMTQFIPRKANLLTTEEEMLPILTQKALESRTRISHFGWLEAGLITPDILDRFSYQEHPYNIALVLGLADSLGIDRDFALKEMADRVIPDLGVLKSFPPAAIGLGRLEFVNGMSANERFGTLSNWKRMQFDTASLEKSPEMVISTLVNNRADRISRSRMYAAMLVKDIQADYHFLIGTNLNGLLGYIKEELTLYLSKMTLWPKDTGKIEDPGSIFFAAASQMRVFTSKELVLLRLDQMLKKNQIEIEKDRLDEVWDRPDLLEQALEPLTPQEISRNITQLFLQDHTRFFEYQGFMDQLSADPSEQLDKEFRRLLARWFNQKIVVIWDAFATGEQIIDIISKKTPAGLLNRLMGMQNIKGTGLDVVHRFQAWESCYQLCCQLTSKSKVEADKALKELTAFQDFGLLSESHLKDTIAAIQNRPGVQTEKFQAAISLIQSNQEKHLALIRKTLQTQIKPTLFLRMIQFVESFLDAGDAIRRRKTANRIYRDMIADQISHDRAAIELKKLTQRQKGGWLLERIKKT